MLPFSASSIQGVIWCFVFSLFLILFVYGNTGIFTRLPLISLFFHRKISAKEIYIFPFPHYSPMPSLVPIWDLFPSLLKEAVLSFHVIASSLLNIGKMEIILHIIMVVANNNEMYISNIYTNI